MTATVTAKAGSGQDTVAVYWTSEDPFNAGDVTVDFAPAAQQDSGVLPEALRIDAPQAGERAAAIEATPAFVKGWMEVQDLGSQIAAACAGEVKGQQVLDLCAGGGGKTLALAAAMENTGQIYAYDADARRLTDTIRRAERAGVRNLQVRSPVKPDALKGLDGRMDLVGVRASDGALVVLKGDSLGQFAPSTVVGTSWPDYRWTP